VGGAILVVWTSNRERTEQWEGDTIIVLWNIYLEHVGDVNLRNIK